MHDIYLAWSAIECLETTEFDTLPSQLPPKTLGEKISM